MTPFTTIARGHFSTRTLRIYVAIEAVVFWSIIFQCWRLFPVENSFTIHTHTFSYLGSFELDRNPAGWFLFCIAMTLWGLASIPLVLYSTRRLLPVAPRAGRAARFLLLTGCAGITLVGLAPDAGNEIIGTLRWTDLHYVGALVLVLGFLIGVPTAASIVFRAARDPRLDSGTRRGFARARWPHAFFLMVSGIALFFLIRWLWVYEVRKAAAEAAGLEFGSPWREAMNTPYSFPLWDNVFVYTLFIYLAWTALVMPATVPENVRGSSARIDTD